jgi:ABC-type glycerol-3-phosphate transport system substrate-binding protein
MERKEATMFQPIQTKSLGRRSFLKAAALLASAVTVSACAPAVPQAGETGAAAQEAGPTTITIWGWPAADVAYQSFLPKFEEQYPDIKTDIQMMPGGDEHTKLLAALAAGAGAPDVGMIEINHIDKFVVKGGLVNLLDAPYDGVVYKDDMVEYKWRQATAPDGRLVAFPWDIGPATSFIAATSLTKQASLPTQRASLKTPPPGPPLLTYVSN